MHYLPGFLHSCCVTHSSNPVDELPEVVDSAVGALSRSGSEPPQLIAPAHLGLWGLLWGICSNEPYPALLLWSGKSLTTQEQGRTSDPRARAHNPEVGGFGQARSGKTSQPRAAREPLPRYHFESSDFLRTPRASCRPAPIRCPPRDSPAGLALPVPLPVPWVNGRADGLQKSGHILCTKGCLGWKRTPRSSVSISIETTRVASGR